MRNIKLVLEYDGTAYAGWQRQKNAPTIQESVERSVLSITGEEISVTGCSRTDAGVHAKEFVCNFHTNSMIAEGKFRDALNAKLPEDIRIHKSLEVEEDFHSRYDCKGKTYCYTILNQEVNSPIYRNYVCHIRQPLNIYDMSLAAKYFVGTHDFQAFRKLGSSVKTTVRTISQLEVLKEGKFIKIYGTADGFLYNMMRIIAGTLIDVGQGKILPEQIPLILDGKPGVRPGKVAPAQGLCLEKVYY
ncbi:MAG: tRNA pseudouridine(38-40) synthase TruA [Clostridiales bacterium]|uniref:tRNA pseudouridine(38-40) synthase TruA n=1 Tax=Clostridium sp. N3C TaxID=1776758 RepID=UPI00092E0989|nr:tRNA pseudouridine(38-40) synthase TruA [Clostridium sp. N3C]NLZ49863.1 tRNA pseudouridine(38-40) synthase TruA [Clostridiales bacterium]SCN24121.1 tRNA pseudouridine synthase A [Clostridium sp. N3C]